MEIPVFCCTFSSLVVDDDGDDDDAATTTTDDYVAPRPPARSTLHMHLHSFTRGQRGGS